MTTLNIMTFEQWKKANPDLEDVEEECDMCGGTGVHVCDCGDEHECCECHGVGMVVELTLKQQYQLQRERDEILLFRHKNR